MNQTHDLHWMNTPPDRYFDTSEQWKESIYITKAEADKLTI